MAKLLTHDEAVKGEHYPMLLERTIIQRVPEGKKIEPLEYETLLLDGIACPYVFEQDKLFLEQFANLTSLSLNNCALKNLDNFPYLGKLAKLEMQENKIQKGLDVLARQLPSLESLKLGNNEISSLKDLGLLAACLALKKLDVVGNPVCELNNYVDKVFEVLPDVAVVDGFDQAGNEVHSDEEDLFEEHSFDDYGDEQDMIADGVLEDKHKDGEESGSLGEEEVELSSEGKSSSQSEQDSDPHDCSSDDSGSEQHKPEKKTRKKISQSSSSSEDPVAEDRVLDSIINLGKRKAKALKSVYSQEKRRLLS